MADNRLYDTWWNEQATGEQRMEDEHLRHWAKVLRMVDEPDLSGLSILDFGCNQGGFLRFLYERRPFMEGVGIDLARQSIAVANERKGSLPLQYEATSEPERFADRFDMAFSISVIYLIGDLREHAWKIGQALKPGGVYYATYTDYSGNPSLPHIAAKINAHGAVPMNEHSLDDIATAFFSEGFRVAVRRMPPDAYVELNREDRWFLQIKDRMQYEYEQAYIFRFTAPGE